MAQRKKIIRKGSTMKPWGSVATWAGVGFTMAANLAQMAYIFGVVLGRISTLEAGTVRYEAAFKTLEAVPTRITFAEESLRRIEGNVNDLSKLMADVAVIKSQLSQLNDNLKQFQANYDKRR